jgi:hypothetical protein
MRRLLALAVATAVLTAGCGSSTATLVPTPAPTAPPTAAVTGTPAPTPTLAPTAVPTLTPVPTPTPYPTGVPGALAFMKAYIDFQVTGDFPSAWAMLGSGQQVLFGSEPAFAQGQATFVPTMEKGYTLTPNPSGYMSLAEWIAGQAYAGSIDKTGAVLALVEWTALKGTQAGWEMWVVNPTAIGWELYQVR